MYTAFTGRAAGTLIMGRFGLAGKRHGSSRVGDALFQNGRQPSSGPQFANRWIVAHPGEDLRSIRQTRWYHIRYHRMLLSGSPRIPNSLQFSGVDARISRMEPTHGNCNAACPITGDFAISDQGLAREISEFMLAFSKSLQESVRRVQDRCSPEETKAYKKAAATIYSDIFIWVLEPLYKRHPALKPADWD
jgi:hypothetical protein